MGNPARNGGGAVALIVAAGRGQRFGGTGPKQYALLRGQPILRHTVRRFLEVPAIDSVLVVIHPDDTGLYDATCGDLPLSAPILGGTTRQESVINGLRALEGLSPARVLIHDAARPLVTSQVINHVLEALQKNSAVVPAIPIADTLKKVQDARIVGTMDRTNLWAAQTPQGFDYPALLSAHQRIVLSGLQATDDGMVMEHAGIPVAIVQGDPDNIKITGAEDLQRAEKLMAENQETRVGTGFDAHRFSEGSQVTLCGVTIPFRASLAGHSDADVALHAVTDAILGALGEEDIGHHFPPSDAQWKGASSDRFIAFAAHRVAARHGRILNVDLTIICQEPRISPHRDQMRHRLASLLGVEKIRVSIKGTTTEGMGFTGRGEGIAAMATATIAVT